MLLDGISACADSPQEEVSLEPNEPLTVFVHGCFSSGGRFRSLAQVFAAHGQQVLCFNYDDREKLTTSAETLRSSLARLEALHHSKLTVIGHSQGGLVARTALSKRFDGEYPLRHSYRLVSVSSPFNGIKAADHCGLWPLHALSLGITVGVCQAVTGSKWSQIHSKSELVRSPPALNPAVEAHLAVVTDERASCRRYGDGGKCEEDDFVFSVDEQVNPQLKSDPRLTQDVVRAGHVEIVGQPGTIPTKLLDLLEQKQILGEVEPERRAQLQERLATIYRN